MKLTCTKCKQTYTFDASLIFKQGPIFTYVKCASCGKIAAVKNESLGNLGQPVAKENERAPESVLTDAEMPAISPENKPYTNSMEEDQKVEQMTDFQHQKAAGIAFTITKAIRQQLYDLGYTKEDVYAMNPEVAQEIIRLNNTKSGGIRKARHAQPEIQHPGWLIVHDERVNLQSFDLNEGRNIVGRKASSATVDIAIETDDMTMSRRHCLIEVVLNERRGEYDFLISDLNALNGIILNSRIQRRLGENDVIYLNDGDTFQLGLTKIVFKRNTEMRVKEAVVREVANQPYEPTVVISKDRVQQMFKNA